MTGKLRMGDFNKKSLSNPKYILLLSNLFDETFEPLSLYRYDMGKTLILAVGKIGGKINTKCLPGGNEYNGIKKILAGIKSTIEEFSNVEPPINLSGVLLSGSESDVIAESEDFYESHIGNLYDVDTILVDGDVIKIFHYYRMKSL